MWRWVELTGTSIGSFLRWAVAQLKKLAPLPQWLNWCLAVVEPLVVLAIAIVILYLGYGAVFQPQGSSMGASLKELIEEINDNWKAGILLLIVLFYRTVRTFLEQAEEALGVKRKLPRLRPVGEPEEGATPTREETP
jgi:hypothetical protein